MGSLTITPFAREWYEIEGRIMSERILVIKVRKQLHCDYEEITLSRPITQYDQRTLGY